MRELPEITTLIEALDLYGYVQKDCSDPGVSVEDYEDACERKDYLADIIECLGGTVPDDV